MATRGISLDSELLALDSALAMVRAARYPMIERIRAGLAAARFHLNRSTDGSPLLAILGGTGTGKSTILNRLLGSDITATSFRRTFTAGAIAVTSTAARIPPRWLGLDHDAADPSQLPARGQLDK